MEAAFEQVGAAWGRLDFLLHAIAFAPVEDLHGRVVDCSAAGFAVAMDGIAELDARYDAFLRAMASTGSP